MRTRGWLAACIVIGGALMPLTDVIAQPATLDIVKARGQLKCGVNPGLPGFAYPDDKGAWRGLDVDICRAVAAAALGDASKVQFVPLSAKERFTALQSGEIDMLSRNTTWTLLRSSQLGLTFVATVFFDGQAFMVKSASGIKEAKMLAGASICVLTGTSTEKTLADFFSSRGFQYRAVTFDTADAAMAAYEAGRCDSITSDQSQLVANRSRTSMPTAHVVLPDIISKEPLSPAVRNGDERWANIARWSIYALLEGEELGLSSKNVREMAGTSLDPNIQRFAGRLDDLGKSLGLENEWAVRIIEQVGNYAESFDRNLRPIGLERGVNRLWKDGGLMIAPPIR